MFLILNPAGSFLHLGNPPQHIEVPPGVSLFYGQPPTPFVGHCKCYDRAHIGCSGIHRYELKVLKTVTQGNALEGFSDDARAQIIEACFHAATLDHFSIKATLTDDDHATLKRQSTLLKNKGRLAGLRFGAPTPYYAAIASRAESNPQ